MVIFSAGIAVNLASLLHTFIGFFHSTKLWHHTQRKEENNSNGKDRIKAIGDRTDISLNTGFKSQHLHTCLVNKKTCVKNSPCRKRKQYTHRSTGGIQHISQRLSRDLTFVADTFHADADGKHIQIIIHKDQDTHNKSSKKGFSLGITELRNQFLETKSAFRLLKKSDQTSKQTTHQNDPYIFSKHILDQRTPLRQKILPIHEYGRQKRTSDQKFHTSPGCDRTDDNNQKNKNCNQSSIHFFLPFPSVNQKEAYPLNGYAPLHQQTFS